MNQLNQKHESWKAREAAESAGSSGIVKFGPTEYRVVWRGKIVGPILREYSHASAYLMKLQRANTKLELLQP